MKALLSVREAAEYLGIGQSTTYRLVEECRLPSVRIGGSIRIPLTTLDEFLRVKTTDPECADFGDGHRKRLMISITQRSAEMSEVKKVQWIPLDEVEHLRERYRKEHGLVDDVLPLWRLTFHVTNQSSEAAVIYLLSEDYGAYPPIDSMPPIVIDRLETVHEFPESGDSLQDSSFPYAMLCMSSESITDANMVTEEETED